MTASAGKIVVGVDGSAAALSAVRWAAGQAASRGLDLHIVSLLAPMTGEYGAGLPVPPGLTEQIAAAVEHTVDEAVDAAHDVGPGLAVTVGASGGLPVSRLLEVSQTARMIVLGGSDRRVSELATARAACPVVVLRRCLDGQSSVFGDHLVTGQDGGPLGERGLAKLFDTVSWLSKPMAAAHRAPAGPVFRGATT